MSNPGYLKLELLLRGIRLERSALAAPGIMRALALSESLGAPLEVTLILEDNVMVSIPVLECLNRETPYSLSVSEGVFYVCRNGERVAVELGPTPAFYDNRTASGTKMGDIGRVYGDYLVITPTGACEFITASAACRYCDLESKKAPDRSVADVVETAAAAAREGLVGSVCFNVGFSRDPDGGIKMIERHITAIKKELGLLICVQAQPPAADEWVDYTYAIGVDSLAYNLEVYDPEIFRQVAPGKAEMIGRERYLAALKRAARVFPEGAVVSNLIVGLEPLHSTMKGIDYLTSVGVVPTLPVARPDTLGALPVTEKIGVDDIAGLFRYLQTALNRNKLAPSLISHFNMAVNAIDGNFFGGESPIRKRVPAVLRGSAGSRLALGIRRKLRVRSGDQEPRGL